MLTASGGLEQITRAHTEHCTFLAKGNSINICSYLRFLMDLSTYKSTYMHLLSCRKIKMMLLMKVVEHIETHSLNWYNLEQPFPNF